MSITQEGGFLEAEDLVKVQMFTWFNFQIAITTWHYRTTKVGLPLLTLGRVAQSFSALIKPLAVNCFGTGVRYLGVKVSSISSIFLPAPGIFTDEVLVDGPSAPITTGVTGLIKWTTGRKGRSGRGRSFIPFLPTDFVGPDGWLGDGLRDQMQELADGLYKLESLIIDAGQVDTQMVVYTKTGLQPSAVNSGSAELRVATQRRRSSRGGLNQPIIT